MGVSAPSMVSSPLKHLNIDLQGSGISLAMLDSHMLSQLSRLQSLTYHCYGRFPDDATYLQDLSSRFRRVQCIHKGLSVNADVRQCAWQSNLVAAVQEITTQDSARRTLTLHTVPYPDKMLCLPFVHWGKVNGDAEKGTSLVARPSSLRRSRFQASTIALNACA